MKISFTDSKVAGERLQAAIDLLEEFGVEDYEINFRMTSSWPVAIIEVDAEHLDDDELEELESEFYAIP